MHSTNNMPRALAGSEPTEHHRVEKDYQMELEIVDSTNETVIGDVTDMQGEATSAETQK